MLRRGMTTDRGSACAGSVLLLGAGLVLGLGGLAAGVRGGHVEVVWIDGTCGRCAKGCEICMDIDNVAM